GTTRHSQQGGYVQPMADVNALLDLAVDLANEAGRLLLDQAPDRTDDVGTKSSRTDMVTAVDRASEALIVGAIERERPDDGVLGATVSRSPSPARTSSPRP